MIREDRVQSENILLQICLGSTGSPKFIPMELLDSISDDGVQLFRFRRLLPFCFISLSVEITSPKKDPLRGSQIFFPGATKND